MKSTHEWSQYIAEFIGTFFLIFFGCGSVILADLGNTSVASFIPIVFGGAVAIMIYSVGHISGAHLNPAVTLAFWAVRRLPRERVLGYFFGQFAGAVLASLCHLLVWGSEHSFGATSVSTSLISGIIVEVLLSFVLMFVITSVATDSRAIGEMAGMAIGTTVALCAFVGGPLTGASMNPARSFGPAIVSWQMSDIFIYLIAPFIGTLLGAFTYEWIRCQKEGVESEHGCC